MRAPTGLLAAALAVLSLASCQSDPVSQSSAEVRLAPRWLATEPVPTVQRIRIALLVDGTPLNTLDLHYTSGQELSLGTVPYGSAFEIALVGYDTLNGGVARWGARSQGVASMPRVQEVEIALQVPARPVAAFSGTTTLDFLTSSDSLWGADVSRTNHPARVADPYPLGAGTRVPVSGALVFARKEPANFLPASLASAWSAFATVWSDTVMFAFTDPTELAVQDSFVDTRDGRTYHTTTWLGTTWMAENLAWAGPDGTLGLCYENDPASCARFGRLYTWSQAMSGSTPSTAYPGSARGICPTGWHLPSPAEWDTLAVRLGGRGFAADSLRDGASWSGQAGARDAIGFSALPSGQGYASDTTFTSKGTDAWWWTSERRTSSDAVNYNMTIDRSDLYLSLGVTSGPYEQMFAVRCVKDQP